MNFLNVVHMVNQNAFEVTVMVVSALGVLIAVAAQSQALAGGAALGGPDAPLPSASPRTWRTYCDLVLKTWPKETLKYTAKIFEKMRFGVEALRLKRMAKSMNHFQVLLGKLALGLPIEEKESEQKSYLDLKRSMGPKWPFMWTMNSVRSRDEVIVNDLPCRVYSSYAYLDFVRDDRVQEAAITAARQYASGNHGPRMLGGNTLILRELEKKLATWLGRDDALCLSAGYLACASAIAGLLRKGDVIFADAYAHASLRAGIKLSGVKTFFFRHNDFDACKKLVEKNRHKYRNAWVIIESVYSMDGDIGNLPVARKLCDEHQMKIILDEAHGLGVLGEGGRGAEEHFGCPGAADVIVGTFSKSFSSVGGYIVSDRNTVEFLDFHAPGNVFSAPLSAYHAGAALKALELMQTEQCRLDSLKENMRYLRRALETGNGHWREDYPQELKYVLEGDASTCVMPLVLPDDPIRVLSLAERMRQKGFAMAAVCAPACPVRRPRFRITATSAYSKQDMDEFVEALVKSTMETPRMIPDVMQ